MIPEVAAVVEAAGAMVDACGAWTNGLGPGDEYPYRALVEAVEALRMRASRPVGAVTYEEQDRTWGEATAGDEILSTKTGRWYEVANSVRTPDGNIKLNIKGSAKPIIRPVGDPVKIKRGVLGDAADTLELLWSGPHNLGAARTETKDVGPMIKSTEETEEEDESDG